MTLILIALALSATAFWAVVRAQPRAVPALLPIRSVPNQDGLYSLTEMLTEYADLTQEDYDALDTNKDGAVDADELAAAIADGRLPSME